MPIGELRQYIFVTTRESKHITVARRQEKNENTGKFLDVTICIICEMCIVQAQESSKYKLQVLAKVKTVFSRVRVWVS